MPAELDRLLCAEAELICPLVIGDVIKLDNGKLGKITEINHYSPHNTKWAWDFWSEEYVRFNKNWRNELSIH